jgi:enoyl-CoA hydratase
MGYLDLEIKEKVAVLWWDNAPANGISADLVEELDQQLDRIENDDSINVVVLTSRLQKIFSAGADAKWFNAMIQDGGPAKFPDKFEKFSTAFRRVCFRIHSGEKIYIAAMNGHTVAGGLELASACDLRFAAQGIKLGVPEIELFGAIPSGGGGTQYISRILGPNKAFSLIALGETITSEKGLELGLVDQVFPVDQLLEETLQFAAKITSNRKGSGLSGLKKATFFTRDKCMADALDMDKEILFQQIRGDSFLSGIDQFVNQFGKKRG